MIYTAYTEQEQATWDLAVGLASSLHWALRVILGSTEGACLISAAHIAALLCERGIKSVAVRGEYHMEGYTCPHHWWLELPQLNLRLDPTRDQFEDVQAGSDTDIISHLDDGDVRYKVLSRFDSAWTREQAQAEVMRATGGDHRMSETVSDQIFWELDELASFNDLPVLQAA